MNAFATRPLTCFEEKVVQRLDALGLSMLELAKHVGLPESELRARCAAGDPRLSELQQFGQALRIDPVYFLPSVQQTGAFIQNGTGNVQKIKIGKAAAHQLAAQLRVCQHLLDMANRLVAAKEEIITLLKAAYDRPN